LRRHNWLTCHGDDGTGDDEVAGDDLYTPCFTAGESLLMRYASWLRFARRLTARRLKTTVAQLRVFCL